MWSLGYRIGPQNILVPGLAGLIEVCPINVMPSMLFLFIHFPELCYYDDEQSVCNKYTLQVDHNYKDLICDS